VFFTGGHSPYYLAGHLASEHCHSEKANLDAKIDAFSTRTKGAEASIEGLKSSIDRQASAIRCHCKRQQVLADDGRRLFLELETIQGKLDDGLELRRKLMAILLEKHGQVCHIDFFLYFVAHFSTA